MVQDLIKVANKLDQLGLQKEADIVDVIIQKMAEDKDWDDEDPADWSESEWDRWEWENAPTGIGTTEPKYTGRSPEESLVTRFQAKKILSNMSDEDFEELKEKHPEAMAAFFGEESVHEMKR